MIFYPHFKKIIWESERKFADLMQSYGYNLIYQPRIYIKGLRRNFNDGTFLAPDFFCFETGYYYEVVNSPNSFEWRKPDILAAILLDVPIKIITPSGNLYPFRCYRSEFLKIIKMLEIRYLELFPNKTEIEKHIMMQMKIAQKIELPIWYLWPQAETKKIGSPTKIERQINNLNKKRINKWIYKHQDSIFKILR